MGPAQPNETYHNPNPSPHRHPTYPASTNTTNHPDPRTTRRLKREFQQDCNEHIQTLFDNAILTENDNHRTTHDKSQNTTMEHDRAPKLPELDAANYAPWYLALETYATTIKATSHLETNPPIPTDPALHEEHITKRSKLLSAVLSSVPSEILGLILVPNDRPSPFDLVTKVIAHINQSTKDDHKYLKIVAESITYTSDTNIDAYIKSHIDIRQKMIAAKYPAITDEETTVDFIIAGLRKNASLIPVVGPLLVHKPSTIKQFTRCFKDLHTLYKPVHGPTPPAQPTPRFTGDNNNNYYYSPRGRGYYRRPYRQWGRRAPAPQRRLAPGQVPCQFHTSLGIPSQHTDAECQDRCHPKYHCGILGGI